MVKLVFVILAKAQSLFRKGSCHFLTCYLILCVWWGDNNKTLSQGRRLNIGDSLLRQFSCAKMM